MNSFIEEYIVNLNRRYKTGLSREHSYRGDLQNLLEKLNQEIIATNEPSRIECGSPDFIVTKNNIPVGYIEAKDVGKNLFSHEYNEQFERYKNSLENLVLTNYLEFKFIRNGEVTNEIVIGEIQNNTIVPIVGNFERFETLFNDFSTYIGQTIKSPFKLSQMMAGKAKLLALIINNAITSDENTTENGSLREQFLTFRKILINDITEKEFADIYAQTLAYGMFAARLHDKSLDNFTRQEAAELIPKTNPFLRKLFGYIAGPDIDDRIKWIVDALAEIFRSTDIASLLSNFDRTSVSNNPIIHFYETFLSEYDPELRKSRGVWYTPEPVVDFIVRATDDILKADFNLSDGLADSSKITIKVDTDIKDIRLKNKVKSIDREIHKVQILDPATGTGTFLANIIKKIHGNFIDHEGIWSSYVENELIPRLNGFEILMASYAMAHLQLDLLLNESGYIPKSPKRMKVYLTNTLEEHHPDTGTLFSSWLSNEAVEANYVKKEIPVMVIMGNPPYSISSYNKSKFINNLMDKYKEDIRDEKNIQLLSDDYAKFIRFCHFKIEQTGSGVIALITKNTYLNTTAFKGMRVKLLEYFDKIYVLNLHGKLYEKTPTGENDENVFDIRVGTAILILVKNNGKKANDYASLNYKELYGNRESKYDYLMKNKISTIDWDQLNSHMKYSFFEKKDYVNLDKYGEFLSLTDIFVINNSGVETGRDHFIISDKISTLTNNLENFINSTLTIDQLRTHFKLENQPNFNLEKVKKIFKRIDDSKFEKYSHKPYYNRYIYFDNSFLRRSSMKVMSHMQNNKDNLALVVKKRYKENDYSHCFCAENIVDRNFLGGQTYVFPLYLYKGDNSQQNILDSSQRIPNINIENVKKLFNVLDLSFSYEKKDNKDSYSPIDIFNYVYAVLHTPTYREKYNELLKFDFPRIPSPKDVDSFWTIVKLGDSLRKVHLQKIKLANDLKINYPVSGNNVISSNIDKNNWIIMDEKNQLGRIMINETQYFDNIPIQAWEQYVGGIQPAQKWLKDHKGQELTSEDIFYYQNIILSIVETINIMDELERNSVAYDLY